MGLPGWEEGQVERVVTEEDARQIILYLKVIKDSRVALGGDMAVMVKKLIDQNTQMVANILAVLGVK